MEILDICVRKNFSYTPPPPPPQGLPAKITLYAVTRNFVSAPSLAQRGFQERLQRRLPAIRTAVGRQCLVGTNRPKSHWGRAEMVGGADRNPQVQASPPPPPFVLLKFGDDTSPRAGEQVQDRGSMSTTCKARVRD